jgi:hypothetical protein
MGRVANNSQQTYVVIVRIVHMTRTVQARSVRLCSDFGRTSEKGL